MSTSDSSDGRGTSILPDTGETPVTETGLESTGALDALPTVRELAESRHRLNRTLFAVAVWLLIAASALGGSLLLFLRSTDTGVPRTEAERELMVARSVVEAIPEDSEAWARYARSLAAVERVEDALAAVDEGIERTGDDLLVLVSADVLRLDGRYSDAITAYNLAEARFGKLPSIVERSDYLAQVTYGRGLSEIAVGDADAGLADLERSTQYVPASADTWVALGDAYASVGRDEDAEEAYREALRFVPDHPGALQGLARVGGDPR